MGVGFHWGIPSPLRDNAPGAFLEGTGLQQPWAPLEENPGVPGRPPPRAIQEGAESAGCAESSEVPPFKARVGIS